MSNHEKTKKTNFLKIQEHAQGKKSMQIFVRTHKKFNADNRNELSY